MNETQVGKREEKPALSFDAKSHMYLEAQATSLGSTCNICGIASTRLHVHPAYEYTVWSAPWSVSPTMRS